ncbi:hypothetical protein MINT15_10220 [Saccharomonospora viridis]|uniref:Uncharacterized protein n=1 Tax=Saccharomonospora viridis TaxID=1852 RepID=A0A837D9D1_9PSEU|nr:hypothetical protein MINT15_10220 [Saccharomonospora viridis]
MEVTLPASRKWINQNRGGFGHDSENDSEKGCPTSSGPNHRSRTFASS